MSADDATVYDYENVAIIVPSWWRVGAAEFAVIDTRAAYTYDYENVT